MKLVAKCCGHVFYGWNHSPEHGGRCRACGNPWEGTCGDPYHVDDTVSSKVYDECPTCKAKFAKQTDYA